MGQAYMGNWLRGLIFVALDAAAIGTWYNNNNASTTLSSGNHDITLQTQEPGWLFGIGMSRNGSNNITWEYNWGQPSFSISSGNSDSEGHGNFEYAVPSGFFACCTKNLAEYG